MRTRDKEPGESWWEYPWFAFVTVFLLAVGAVLFVAGLFTWVIRKMTRTKTYLILLAVLFSLSVIWVGYSYYHDVDLGERTVTIIIEEGASFHTVAEELIAAGVVDARFTLKQAARLTKVDRKLTPGRYDFTARNSCRSVLTKLREADVYRIKVTIPEGASIWKVATILASAMDIDSSQVMDLSADSAFLQTLDLPYLEGYLFPETYFFPWGTRARAAITEMVAMYRRMTDTVWPQILPLELTRQDIIILASIVEAETSVETERVIVASVYRNRLRLNMKLDADPTVIYGLGGLDRPLYTRDLEKDGPYNTYLHKGLPPTPLNSPGLASIKAALNPAETEYLYFVADNTGGHRFSRTNAEHNRARREIKAQELNR